MIFKCNQIPICSVPHPEWPYPGKYHQSVSQHRERACLKINHVRNIGAYLCESSGQTLSPGKFSTLADSSDLEYFLHINWNWWNMRKSMRWIGSGGTCNKTLNRILPFSLPPLIGHHPVCTFSFVVMANQTNRNEYQSLVPNPSNKGSYLRQSVCTHACKMLCTLSI